MKSISAIAGLIVLLAWASCASLSMDSRLVGYYLGENSESLLFLADARVFHTEMIDGKEKRAFLGYYVSRSSIPGTLSFVGPDASPFVGTSLLVSEEFATVTVSWRNLREPRSSWQVVYRKSTNAN